MTGLRECHHGKGITHGYPGCSSSGHAFHLAGYGFSGEPTGLGWESGRIARAWAELMDRLGYTGYVAQGGDVGATVTDAMGRRAPEGLLGIHVNLLAGAIGLKDQLPAKSEQAVYPNLTYFNEVESGGHFPAWEEPELFATEVRAAFRALRKS